MVNRFFILLMGFYVLLFSSCSNSILESELNSESIVLTPQKVSETKPKDSETTTLKEIAKADAEGAGAGFWAGVEAGSMLGGWFEGVGSAAGAVVGAFVGSIVYGASASIDAVKKKDSACIMINFDTIPYIKLDTLFKDSSTINNTVGLLHNTLIKTLYCNYNTATLYNFSQDSITSKLLSLFSKETQICIDSVKAQYPDVDVYKYKNSAIYYNNQSAILSYLSTVSQYSSVSDICLASEKFMSNYKVKDGSLDYYYLCSYISTYCYSYYFWEKAMYYDKTNLQ